MFDWDDLRYFIAVGRAGSFNAAARDLATSQPTVSRKISSLEEKLGLPVFFRQPEGIALTEVGRSLWERALIVEEAVSSFSKHLEMGRRSDRASIRISATEGIGSLWLTPRLLRFSQVNPEISLQLLLDTRSVDLLRREADIAIRLSRPLTPNLIAKKVGQLTFGLFASREYLLRNKPPLLLADIKKHNLVTLALRESKLDEVWQDLHDSGASIAFSTNSSVAEIAAVSGGFGIGLIPKYAGPLFGLVPILPDIVWRRRDIWLLIHPESRKFPKIRAAFDEIASIFYRDKSDLNR